jgi:hypothetical protein
MRSRRPGDDEEQGGHADDTDVKAEARTDPDGRARVTAPT